MLVFFQDQNLITGEFIFFIKSSLLNVRVSLRVSCLHVYKKIEE